jgi:bifunctional DNA-binding transcriptional regulator/antitoxin component of YhaV-PrlF toxin-antitoxin module
MANKSDAQIIQPMSEGQIRIPASMRGALGIDETSLLEIRLDGDHLTISNLTRRNGENVRVFSDEEIAEFMEEDKISPELADWARDYVRRRRP